MAIHHQTLAFAFGILGNIISVLVFLAPIPTFYVICKKKSAEGFQSYPYVVALFSCMLWIYYALIKKESTLLLITINSYGIVVKSIYIAIFLFYAPKKLRLATIKLILLLNVFGFGAMLLSTLYFSQGAKRIQIIGWFNMLFNIGVFGAPLLIMRQVIRTKNVEYMPFTLSMFLTANAVMWFFYGLLLKDYFVALPNILGFLFGIVQMVLYLMYRNAKPVMLGYSVKAQELASDHTINDVEQNTMVPEDANSNEDKNTNFEGTV